MNFIDDTIVAVSTPVGQGGIGIVRLSGSQSIPLADRIFRKKKKGSLSNLKSHSLTYGHIIDPGNQGIIDEVLVSVMRAPNSYTKEAIVEINCHGGMISVKKILELLLDQGARLAEPGEFTKRAFLNGRIGLTEAEAVLDLINAKTDESMKIALDQLKGELSKKLSVIRDTIMQTCVFAEAHIDFPEDEIETDTTGQMLARLKDAKQETEKLLKTYQEARFFREGLAVAISGRPNVGKSSLLNAFLEKDRAIVTEIPGTTRDQIEEFININGLPIRIIDTAGIRHSDETVELEGIRRSLDAIESADCIIAVFDGSEPLNNEDRELLNLIKGKNALIAVNKSDLPQEISFDGVVNANECIHISALTGEGLEELKSVLFHSNLRDWKEEREGVIVTNIRHKQALENSCSALERAIAALTGNQPLEIFSIELRDALDSIGEIIGTVTTEDILNKIFSDFCIGK
jgi:tRNA modification GTPase